ncbi:MAG: diphthamide synthesis protein [Candidatus Nanoarchaeia archaeon]
METLHIETKYTGKFSLQNLEMVEEKVSLVTTVQYLEHLEKIRKHLEATGKTVSIPKSDGLYPGQILGCTIKKLEGAEAILYIGDGKFHPIAIALENQLPVYTFNPLNESFHKIRESEVDKLRKIQKGGIAKFHTSEKIGVLVSLKPGQSNMSSVKKLKDKYPQKKFFTFIFDTLSPDMLESFNFVECFVNTACPRISYDDYQSYPKKIVNYTNLI